LAEWLGQLIEEGGEEDLLCIEEDQRRSYQ